MRSFANRRNTGGAMSHDGNSDRLDAGRVLRGMENASCVRTFQYRSESGGLCERSVIDQGSCSEGIHMEEGKVEVKVQEEEVENRETHGREKGE